MKRYHLFALVLVFATVGCRSDKNSESDRKAPRVERKKTQLSKKDQRKPLLASEKLSKTKDDKKKKQTKKKPKDYWSKVIFGRAEFEHMRRYVRRNYYHPYIDEKMAYISAANYALLTAKPAYELYPVEFHKLRKGHKDERGRLKGKIFKLKSGDRYLVIKYTKPTKLKRKNKFARFSDDKIRELRAKAKARSKLLKREWAKVPFGEQDFWALIDWLKEKNQKNAKFKLKKIYIAAAQGYLNSLDPHSSLVSRQAWVRSTATTKDSSFEGIGAILTTRNGFTIVESPLQGRPAHKAGLRAGDTIIKVNKESIVKMPLPQVVQRIRGKKGTKVVLTVRREGYGKHLKIAIIRDHIAIKNVQGRLIKNYKNLGYIKVTGFVDDTDDKLMKMYNELQAKAKNRLRGLILDLRNNSGGLLDQSVKMADRFLTKGVIVTIKNRRFDDQVRRATPGNTLTIPLIILVNDGSASASEILASAIQEHGRGLVLGDRTFGKASVQTLFPNNRYSPTYYIKLTISRYYAPSGRTLQVTGVIPDVTLPPKIKGKMPLGFREENLSNHLSQLGPKLYKSPNSALIKKLTPCLKKKSKAEKIHAKDPNPQLKFDYQLVKGADYLECLIEYSKKHVSLLRK